MSTAVAVEMQPWLTFWGEGAQKLAFSAEWISYVREDLTLCGGYLQQPGYLQADGFDPDVGGNGARAPAAETRRVH